MTSQRFTQTPDPATPGQAVLICYDTTHASLPTSAKGTLYPSGEIPSHEITSDPATHCWDVQIPRDCTGGLIEDASGQSDTFALLVTT